MRRALLFACLIAAGAACVDNRDAVAVTLPEAGSRVRVSVMRDSVAASESSNEPQFIGQVTKVMGDTLVVAPEGDAPPLTIVFDRIRYLEVSRGRSSHAGRGAWMGLGIGAAAGVITALVVCESGDCVQDSDDLTGWVAVVFGLGGGLTGLGVGALVGGLSHTEHWENVPLREVGVGPLPRRGMPPLGLSFIYRF